ncbi:hypothetical protein CkaCkLH20_11466 [Colletotrichum karsti]|uniref:Maltose/galactoside acetyltransferase domain-containing protein n=1 Tax=Colletotrichum karsti TaxID=1095194 RepID=A0A9P6LD79_9PEZI|nr:uncharacterized protein CkaCkLH20_11466 [Colletotrichum karsti]KAF9871049.1 hypothetical protein CkaCkLH20_11466 [Colletotrichum karsti]
MCAAVLYPDAVGDAKQLAGVPWCQEYEKMVTGEVYDCLAPKLIEQRGLARRNIQKFNNYLPEESSSTPESAWRESLLRETLGRVGKKPWIEPPFTVDYGCNVDVGDGFYANFNLVILDSAIVKIGHRVLMGPSVTILTATHDVEVDLRRQMREFAKPVTIGNDCWIGANVTILPGVTIGKGCTIAAGSIVSKDIPEFSVALGSPAKVVRKVPEVPDI